MATTSARSTRARPARASSCSTRTARSSPSTSASTSRSTPRRAGSSTTRKRSGTRTPRGDRRRAGRLRRSRRATSRRSASPTSARRPWCGTARPASRSTTRSSGRTRARTRSCASCGERASTGCARSPACRSPPTSAGPKIKWILDNVDGARERAEKGELAFGTMDSWVMWNLTGGEEGVHVTDVTNASRDAADGPRDARLARAGLELMGIPRSMLPEIKSSSEAYGEAKGTAIGGRPIAGILGDQQAALFGQTCFERRRRQEHLRHRLVPARQHRRGDRPHRRRC